MDFDEFFGVVGHSTRTSQLNFCVDPDPDPDPGFFKGFFIYYCNSYRQTRIVSE